MSDFQGNPVKSTFKHKPRYGEDHYKGGEGGMGTDKFHPKTENAAYVAAQLSKAWGFSGFTGDYFPHDQKFSHLYAKPTKGDCARSLDIPDMPQLANRKAKEKMIADAEAPHPTYKEGAQIRTLDAMEAEMGKLLTIYPSGPGWISTFTKPIKIDKEKDAQAVLEEIAKRLGPGELGFEVVIDPPDPFHFLCTWIQTTRCGGHVFFYNV
jgi:hypothetical protein